MSRPCPEQGQVTFHDVAACFSEEDWKRLEEWQKEFYKSVMKDIHQSVISLGYHIINPDTLLRIYKGEEAHIQEPQDPEARGNVVNPDLLFRIIEVEEPYCIDQQSSEDTGIGSQPSTGSAVTNSVNALISKEGDVVSPMDHKCTEQREQMNHSSGLPFLKTDSILRIEDESCVRWTVHSGTETGESINDPSAGHALPASVVSFCIEEDRNAYSVGHQSPERREAIKSPTGDPFITSVFSMSLEEEKETHCQSELVIEEITGNESMKKEWEGGYSLTCPENTTTCNVLSREAKVKVAQISENRTYSGSHLWSENSQTLGGVKTTPCENGLRNNPTHFDLYRGDLKLEKSDTYSDSQNYQRAHTGTGEIHQCTDCEKSFSQKIQLTNHRKTHTRERIHQCTDCEKSFFLKHHLTEHKRTHTREKPYQCTECGKSFSRNRHLIIHERTHTGERPYQCTECGKSFIDKAYFIIHERTHTGEKPYECTQCGKNFSRKGSLLIHARTHTGTKPYQCIGCEKSFSRRATLHIHERTHTGMNREECRENNAAALTSELSTFMLWDSSKNMFTKSQQGEHTGTPHPI